MYRQLEMIPKQVTKATKNHEVHPVPMGYRGISLCDGCANLVSIALPCRSPDALGRRWVALHLFRGVTPNACCKNFLV